MPRKDRKQALSTLERGATCLGSGSLGRGVLERAMGTPESVSKYDPHTTSFRNSNRAVRADPYMFLGPCLHCSPQGILKHPLSLSVWVCS